MEKECAGFRIRASRDQGQRPGGRPGLGSGHTCDALQSVALLQVSAEGGFLQGKEAGNLLGREARIVRREKSQCSPLVQRQVRNPQDVQSGFKWFTCAHSLPACKMRAVEIRLLGPLMVWGGEGSAYTCPLFPALRTGWGEMPPISPN